jgi:hypothetical protein
VTVELPIEVDDANGNGTFDGPDRIVMFVLSWAERSGASRAQREWGDGEVVYATRLAGGAGLRIPTREGWRNQALSTLVSYPFTQRYEQNTNYLSTPPDTNRDQFLWTFPNLFTRPDSFLFEANDLDTAGRVTFSITYQGNRNNSRSTWAHIRNARSQITSVLDSVRWFGLTTFSPSVSLFGSALTEGPSNVLRSWGKTSNTDLLANSSVNFFTATYWRYYRPIEGRLRCNSGAATGVYQVDAWGFPSDRIRVYDVTDSLNPVRLTVDPSRITFDGAEYTLSFQDSAGAERRSYWVFDTPRVPPSSRFGRVTRRDLAGAAPAQYVIVAPEAFVDATAPIAALRQSQGLTVLTAPLESVNDEFNGGRRSPYAIRRFLQYAYDQWGASYVLLVGDGSIDPQNQLGTSGIDWLPAQKIMGPVPAGDLRETIPSDTWFVNFNSAHPGTPATHKLPDLFLGRIPANSVADLQGFVAKLLQYENVGADQAWRKKMLLLADDKYSTVTFFGGGGDNRTEYCERDYENVFLNLNRRVEQIVRDEAGLAGSEIEVFDMTAALRGRVETYIAANGDTCRDSWENTKAFSHAAVTPLIFDRLNQGRLWWNYQGHANQYVLSHEDIYINSPGSDDQVLFENGGMPFFFSGFSCHPNGFAEPSEAGRLTPSIGEEMVMAGGGRGAIASWASTGFEILPTPEFRTEHINTHLARALFADPPRDAGFGEGPGGARVVLGQAITLALARNYVDVQGNSLEDAVGLSYVLLGDPATRLSIGAPQVVVTANGTPVVSGEPVRLYSFGDTLRIEADVMSNVQLTALSIELERDGSTTVIPATEYTVTPAFPDTGLGEGGGRRFALVYRTSLDAGTYRYVLRTTDRNGVPGRFDVVFEFQTQLRAGGAPVQVATDPVASDAALSLLILSPTPIDPVTDMELRLNGTPLVFTATPAAGDTTDREWSLAWTHAPYAQGTYTLDVYLFGSKVATHGFVVSDAVAVRNLYAFPNPFQEELGTRFTFELSGPSAFDAMIRVYTVSGRLVYQRTERGLLPGHHELAWDGRDAEGATSFWSRVTRARS